MKTRYCLPLLVFLVCGQFTVGSLAESGDLDDGFILHMPFDGNANDVSGNEHHGVVTGAALTVDRHGNTNSAYYFDGSSYITVAADDSILNVDTQGWTLSFWVKPDENQEVASAPVVSYGYGSAGGYGIAYWEQYGMFRTSFYDYSWSGMYAAEDELDDHVWYLLAITYDGETLKEYVNGVLVDAATGTYHPTIPAGTHSLRFGAESRYVNQFFKGSIDDVRL